MVLLQYNMCPMPISPSMPRRAARTSAVPSFLGAVCITIPYLTGSTLTDIASPTRTVTHLRWEWRFSPRSRTNYAVGDGGPQGVCGVGRRQFGYLRHMSHFRIYNKNNVNHFRPTVIYYLHYQKNRDWSVHACIFEPHHCTLGPLLHLPYASRCHDHVCVGCLICSHASGAWTTHHTICRFRSCYVVCGGIGKVHTPLQCPCHVPFHHPAVGQGFQR